MPPAARIITVVVAALEAFALLGYAASIAVVALTTGIEGPAEVSSPSGVAVEVITFALLGAGLVAIAWGRWRGHGWPTVPFVLAQLLALTVGIPLATGVAETRLVGIGITLTAILGLVAAFLGGRDPAADLRESPAQPVAKRN